MLVSNGAVNLKSTKINIKLIPASILIGNIFQVKPIDYFKCVQHTGQRPETHHTTPSHRGLGDYTHIPLSGICGTVLPSAYGVNQA